MLCAVRGCQRSREWTSGDSLSLFCRAHLNEMWANKLERQPDATYAPREPEWMRRRRTIGLPAKELIP